MGRNKGTHKTSSGKHEGDVLEASDDAVRREIALRAYYRHCDRGCAPGAELDDWLAAEQDVRAEHLRAGRRFKSSPDA